MRYVILLVAALAVVLGLHTVTRADAPPDVPTWDYRSLVLDISEVLNSSKLRTTGQEGWELVTCSQTVLDGRQGQLLFVFKRPMK